MISKPMHILLATPTYGGMVTEHVSAMMRLQAWLIGRGVKVNTIHHSMAEVARSRNIIATHFWENTQFTHLLFVDSDMSFEPQVVGALIQAEKPFVGMVYPKRKLDLERLVTAARRYQDMGSILAAAMDFVVVPGSETADVEEGRCKVDGIGMGLCLLERRVFADLLKTGQIREDHAGGVVGRHTGPTLGFFDPIPSDTGVMPEDLSFCRRWRELCGGEVWAVLDQEVGHVGTMVYSAKVIDALAPKG